MNTPVRLKKQILSGVRRHRGRQNRLGRLLIYNSGLDNIFTKSKNVFH